jgi:hypothetical protein
MRGFMHDLIWLIFIGVILLAACGGGGGGTGADADYWQAHYPNDSTATTSAEPTSDNSGEVKP